MNPLYIIENLKEPSFYKTDDFRWSDWRYSIEEAQRSNIENAGRISETNFISEGAFDMRTGKAMNPKYSAIQLHSVSYDNGTTWQIIEEPKYKFPY